MTTGNEIEGKEIEGKEIEGSGAEGRVTEGRVAEGRGTEPANNPAVKQPGRRVRRGAKATAVTVTTPWGPSVVVEEVKVAQQAGDKRFTTVVQLLESRAGEVLVRVAYTTDGVARRGPVTLRPRDVERLNALLAARPRLAEALARGGGAT